MIFDEYEELAMASSKKVKYIILNSEAYSELVDYYNDVMERNTIQIP